MINKHLKCSTTSKKMLRWSCDNLSNQITDADEACRSSEISVNLIIIIVFLLTYSYFCYILTSFLMLLCFILDVYMYICKLSNIYSWLSLSRIRWDHGKNLSQLKRSYENTGGVVCLTTKGRQLEWNFEELKPASHVPILGTIFYTLLNNKNTIYCK
jgi:hypothetical protein